MINDQANIILLHKLKQEVKFMKYISKGLNFIKILWKNRSGQGMVEYGLILALVAVGVIALLITMGDELERFFQYIVAQLQIITTP